MTDLSTEIYVAMPVSQPPNEDGFYFTLEGDRTGNNWFRDGKWLDEIMSGKPTHITNYLQKKTLLEVLGSLEIPVWKAGKDSEPTHWGLVHFRDAKSKVPMSARIAYSLHKKNLGEEYEWLSEGNLSDLLYKVADEARQDGYQRGWTDSYNECKRGK